MYFLVDASFFGALTVFQLVYLGLWELGRHV